eukprot:2343202-Pleurochrysis_carterae.AAC.1
MARVRGPEAYASLTYGSGGSDARILAMGAEVAREREGTALTRGPPSRRDLTSRRQPPRMFLDFGGEGDIVRLYLAGDVDAVAFANGV